MGYVKKIICGGIIGACMLFIPLSFEAEATDSDISVYEAMESTEETGKCEEIDQCDEDYSVEMDVSHMVYRAGS